ncbi:DUF5133 domain-containing protein [Streptomyces sp. NBC_00690]|uniref:DUF5133 domain-containing protein n=1 Tax=Streptomyces sp. NBC_00690 TaxID=2975808 RepID=UPI002E2D33A5|nr:DUF5133 domain-containing protein [Streptomyces sp. NBC_00690]
MLMVHLSVLSRLVSDYEALNRQDGDPVVRRRRDDLAYTLCVSTGTRDIDTALAAARHRLAQANSEDATLLPA